MFSNLLIIFLLVFLNLYFKKINFFLLKKYIWRYINQTAQVGFRIAVPKSYLNNWKKKSVNLLHWINLKLK
jgi:hypothetical protein